MNLISSIDEHAGLVRIRYLGEPSFDEWAECMRAIVGDPRFRPGFSFLSDRRGIPALSTGFVRLCVDFLSGYSEEVGGSRWAVVIDSPAAYGMMRVAQVLASEVTSHIEIFTDIDEAEAWLRRDTAPRDS
jgi:hypothetical protein